jgi:hypothetical protein
VTQSSPSPSHPIAKLTIISASLSTLHPHRRICTRNISRLPIHFINLISHPLTYSKTSLPHPPTLTPTYHLTKPQHARKPPSRLQTSNTTSTPSPLAPIHRLPLPHPAIARHTHALISQERASVPASRMQIIAQASESCYAADLPTYHIPHTTYHIPHTPALQNLLHERKKKDVFCIYALNTQESIPSLAPRTQALCKKNPTHPGLLSAVTVPVPLKQRHTRTHSLCKPKKEKSGGVHICLLDLLFSCPFTQSHPNPRPRQKTKVYIKTRHFKTPQTPSLVMLQCKSRMGWMDTRE